MNIKSIMLALVVLPLCAARLPAQDKVVAVKAGRILTVTGEPIIDGVVIIDEGKIVDVGADVNIPEDATVIDASQKVVMPGLVCAGVMGMGLTRGDLNEHSSEITPTFRIAEAIDPASKRLKRMTQAGITTLQVVPGPLNLIAGLGVVIKPQGNTVSEMMLKEDASLWFSLGAASTAGNTTPRSGQPVNFLYRRPTTRMAVAWMIRKSLFDAQQYANEPPESPDADLEILVSAMDGDIPIQMSAARSTDILMAMNLAQEYDLSITLVQCTEGHKMAAKIAERGISAILTPEFDRDSEGTDLRWSNPAILSEAGVRIALAPHPEDEQADLLTLATFAARHGLSSKQALRAITLTPAEILGVADRVGSIDVGKDADLLVLSGDPVATTSRIERVIINGKTVYPPDRGVNK